MSVIPSKSGWGTPVPLPLGNDPLSMLQDWRDDAGRPVVAIDERRFPASTTGVAGERVLFAAVHVPAAAALTLVLNLRAAREAGDPQKLEADLKKRLRTAPRSPERLAVEAVLRHAAIDYYVASTPHLLEIRRSQTVPAVVRTEGGVVDGREARVLMLIVSRSASATAHPDIDFVVDRSKALGLEPAQLELQPDSNIWFDLLDKEHPTTIDGVPTSLRSTARKRLFVVGDAHPLRDLVLLADFSAYFFPAQCVPALGDPRVNEGVLHVGTFPGSAIIAAASAVPR